MLLQSALAQGAPGAHRLAGATLAADQHRLVAAGRQQRGQGDVRRRPPTRSVIIVMAMATTIIISLRN